MRLAANFELARRAEGKSYQIPPRAFTDEDSQRVFFPFTRRANARNAIAVTRTKTLTRVMSQYPHLFTRADERAYYSNDEGATRRSSKHRGTRASTSRRTKTRASPSRSCQGTAEKAVIEEAAIAGGTVQSTADDSDEAPTQNETETELEHAPHAGAAFLPLRA